MSSGERLTFELEATAIPGEDNERQADNSGGGNGRAAKRVNLGQQSQVSRGRPERTHLVWKHKSQLLWSLKCQVG